MEPILGQPGLFLSGLEDDVKSQPVRLLDVFVVGPVMIGGGVAWQKTNPWAGLALCFFGVATIVYNAGNYLKIERR